MYVLVLCVFVPAKLSLLATLLFIGYRSGNPIQPFDYIPQRALMAKKKKKMSTNFLSFSNY